MKKIVTTAQSTMVANNIKAAEMILPHYAPFGITFLKDREAIAAWISKYWGSDKTADALPKTLSWAVGIAKCMHIKVHKGDFFGGCRDGEPGLFSLSNKGNILEWMPGTDRPTRRFGQSVKTDYHFVNLMTRNNAEHEAPSFPCTHEKFNEQFCAEWTLEKASQWIYNPN